MVKEHPMLLQYKDEEAEMEVAQESLRQAI